MSSYLRKLYYNHGGHHHVAHSISKIYTTDNGLSRPGVLRMLLREAMMPLHKLICEKWVRAIGKELKGCNSVLDLGCGYNTKLQQFPIIHKVGVEVFKPYIEESRKKAMHTEYIEADIRNVDFPPGSFDAVFASDVLEHLTKDEGRALLDRADKWARKSVIITTPNGYVRQEGYDGNPYQAHLSGWSASELRARGFKIRGFNGWRGLRNSKAEIRFSPKMLWAGARMASQIIAGVYPEVALQLLATKRVERKQV